MLQIALNISQESHRVKNWYGSVNSHTVENKVRELAKTTRTIIINDLHDEDAHEFKYIPKHMTEHKGVVSFPPIRSHGISFKKTINLFQSQQLCSLIKSFDECDIVMSGFLASLDILGSCIGAIDNGYNIMYLKNGIGDISYKQIKVAEDYLQYYGIEEYVN